METRHVGYFSISDETTLEDLDTQYRKLAFSLHPDHGGTSEQFTQLTQDFERAIAYVGKLARNREQRLKAAALVGLIAREVIADPQFIPRTIDRLQRGELNGVIREKLPNICLDFGKSIIDALIEEDTTKRK